MLMAAGNQVYAVDGGGRTGPVLRFEGGSVAALAEGEGGDVIALVGGRIVVLAGEDRREIDTGMAESVESLLVLREDPLELLIGTEPPHLYRLAGDGPARRVGAFDALECRRDWHTPWGGPPAVRSLARTTDGWVYADVHVGSIMRSDDSGVSWRPVAPELHEDVHQVATCPAGDDRVYANTARAVYVSDDRGGSWAHRADDLDARYGRAVAVDPSDPDLLLATVSDGPHGDDVHGQLWRSEDAGRTWTHVNQGFPASTRRNIDTFHVAFSREGLAWAVAEGVLYAGRQRASRWEPFRRFDQPLRMLACR